jgi:two-component system nitrogen regulation response regulator NtrX
MRYSKAGNKRVGPETLILLQSYPWPGNVRELKNWVERACILSPTNVIDSIVFEEIENSSEGNDVFSFEEKSLRNARALFEKQFIVKMLGENSGNVSRTAQMIGIERSHLHKKMKNYGIEVPGS